MYFIMPCGMMFKAVCKGMIFEYTEIFADLFNSNTVFYATLVRGQRQHFTRGSNMQINIIQ